MNHTNAVLCVWPATYLGGDNNETGQEAVAEFNNWLKNEFNVSGEYEGEFTTLPGRGGEGGRSDMLFWVAADDIPRFAVPRLGYGIRWWGDYVDSEGEIVPADVLGKYADAA